MYYYLTFFSVLTTRLIPKDSEAEESSFALICNTLQQQGVYTINLNQRILMQRKVDLHQQLQKKKKKKYTQLFILFSSISHNSVVSHVEQFEVECFPFDHWEVGTLQVWAQQG